jgi:Flp pilus assembly pilin Flp
MSKLFAHLFTARAAVVERIEGLRTEESGQGLTEYAFILFLVSVVAVLALTNLGQSITAILTKVAQDI